MRNDQIKTYVPYEDRARSNVAAFGKGELPWMIDDVLIRAHGVAAALQALRVTQGHPHAAVACRDRGMFLCATLGAWQAGFAISLPPSLQPESISWTRAQPQVVTVLHDADGERGIDVRLVATSARSAPDLDPIAADRLLATFYTSGTTGEPVPVVKTARQLFEEAELLLGAFPDVARSEVFGAVPPQHLYGFTFGLMLPLRAGAAICRHSVNDETDLSVASLAANGNAAARILISTPAHLRAIAVRLTDAPVPVTRVISSGAPLAQDTAALVVQSTGLHITEILGSSETGVIALRMRGAATTARFRPFPDVRVSVNANEELVVQSPLLPDPSVPTTTRDRVSLEHGDAFEHLGRTDDILKIGGIRISVAELETRLLAIPGVRDAAVVAVHVGGLRGQTTWAALVADGHDAASIRAELGKWLTPVVLPRRYRFVDALPRTIAGKLQRKAVRALFDSPPNEMDEAAPSEDSLS